MAGLARAGAMAPGLDTIRVGFMPLTDCAALVMASVLGFDQRYGIRIDLRRGWRFTAKPPSSAVRLYPSA